MLERVVALVTLVGGGVYLSQALALPFGSPDRPGAGFFPVAVAVFACVVGTVAIVQAFAAPRSGAAGGTAARTGGSGGSGSGAAGGAAGGAAAQMGGSGGSGTGPPVEQAAERRGRVLTGVALLIAFCLLLPWVGYPVLAFAFVALLLRRLGSSWRGAVLTAVLSAGLSHYVFASLLDVPLPRGPW